MTITETEQGIEVAVREWLATWQTLHIEVRREPVCVESTAEIVRQEDDFEYIYNPDGSCHQWDCGKPGVVLAYDDMSPECANWFCADHWQAYEKYGFSYLTIVKDKQEEGKQ